MVQGHVTGAQTSSGSHVHIFLHSSLQAKYWMKRKFNDSQRDNAMVPGAKKGRQGPGHLKHNNENVAMQFVTDADGILISSDCAQAL